MRKVHKLKKIKGRTLAFSVLCGPCWPDTLRAYYNKKVTCKRCLKEMEKRK